MTARRLLVLGDVHCEAVTLERALRKFAHTVDRVLCVGDVVDGEGNAHDTIALLRRYNVTCVQGNHDRWILCGHSREKPEATLRGSLSADDLDWLIALPQVAEIDTVRGKALLAHAFGTDDFEFVERDTHDATYHAHKQWARLRGEAFAMHLCGHTHRPFTRFVAHVGDELRRGVQWINAGTLHRGHDPSVCIVDCECGIVQWHPYSGGRFRAPRVATFWEAVPRW